MKQALLWTVAALLLLTGCIRSLHPVYTEKDLRYDPTLLGRWVDPSSQEVWEFAQGEGAYYDLTYLDSDGEKGLFTVHLLELKGERFLDLYPAEMETAPNSFYLYHLLGLHSIMHVRRIEPTLQMCTPDIDWLKKELAVDSTLIAHDVVDDELILTASTAELQQFWITHLKAEGLFEEYSNLEKR